MSDLEELLEASLMHLGGLERKLEALIKDLRVEARQAVQAGHLERADDLCATIEQIRAELAPLQSDIMSVERRLYGLRRQRRR